MAYSRRMRYAVGDVHGYREEVPGATLRERCIWSTRPATGRAATPRSGSSATCSTGGPDGVGVVSDVMRWQRQAEESGGVVGSVLGNHEVLALGFRRFADAILPSRSASEPPRSFTMSWLVNGGQLRDQELLTDDMAEWISNLPAMVCVGDDLLLHADTTAYLHWGSDAGSVTRAVRAALQGDDLEQVWDLWCSLTTRHAFLGADGPQHAQTLLDAVGARRIVHGHSIIGDLTDVESASVTEAWSYADGLALAVDGGIYDGGPSLVVPLH